MARRRHQNPKPFVEGHWWYMRMWQDAFEDGQAVRKYKRIKLAPSTVKEREVKKIADELVRPVNQGLVTVGAAVNFENYVKQTYLPTVLPLRAKTVQNSYQGVFEKYINPAFGKMSLAEITPLRVQEFFSQMPARSISFPTSVKIRDAFSSIMRSAAKYKYIPESPLKNLEMPPDNRGVREKPFIYPNQFESLVEFMPEPYATMVFTAVWTGLRVSELIGLKWKNIHDDRISVERRYCRGDWSKTKTHASAAHIAVDPEVIRRVLSLKNLTVDVRAGIATRRYKVVKADGPEDLVFQSVKDGKPMNDHNILSRYIKPAAEKLGLRNVNWRCLRTSCATWMVRAGADLKSVQGQMRHSRITTTMEIYAQVLPEGQRQAVNQVTDWARRSINESSAKRATIAVQ